jgi:hypothetical protein
VLHPEAETSAPAVRGSALSSARGLPAPAAGLARVVRGALGRPVLLAVVCALLCGLAVELTPLVGGDLVAQEWWASWATGDRQPVDLGWYGGVPVVSYSLLGPWLSAGLGLPLAGIVGTVLGAGSTTALIGRARPLPGRWAAAGVAAAVTWAADQWSGRTTFGTGAAVACLALVVASSPSARRGGRIAGAALAAVAGGISPLATPFLLLAAAAWWIGTGGPLRSRPAAAVWVAAGALLPLAGSVLLGGVSGPQPASAEQMLSALLATGLTFCLVPASQRVLRTGLAGTALALVLTWWISDPVGSNSTRLVLLFAVPVLVAFARTPPAATVLAVLGVLWLLPPVVVGDLQLRDSAGRLARADSLLDELQQRAPVGRIEVVPEKGHAESLWIARQVPLARGWLRQLDVARGRLFYDDSLDAARYLSWLRDAGVSYVALPGGRLDWPTRPEATLLRRGVPGLQEVWSDGWWRLFRVDGGGMVRGPAVLRSSDRSQLVVDVRAPGRVAVAVWWSRWTSLAGPGGCVRAGDRDGWTTLEVRRPGRYVVGSAWRPGGRCR